MQEYISRLLSWEGYLEKKTRDYQYYDNKISNAGSNNFNRFSRIFDLNMKQSIDGYPWCAAFICANMMEVFGLKETKRLMCGKPSGSCSEITNAFKSAGRWYTSPAVGDLIIFTDAAGVICHIGCVYKVDGSYVYTIEGNTNTGSTVVANGGGVWCKKYLKSYSRIKGYCRPDYKKIIKEDEEMTQEQFNDMLLNFIKTQGVQQFNTLMQNWLKDTANQPESDWSKKEGGFSYLKGAGLMDGTRPKSFITREEVAAIEYRKAKK